MKRDSNFQQFSKLKTKIEKDLGTGTATFASEISEIEVIPSGVLSIDYASGIGGWPRGDIIGVFGPAGMGKTSVIGYSAIAQAQRLGLNCVLIAVEPEQDPIWMAKNGIDVEKLLIVYPANGEEAVSLAYECTKKEHGVDFILFDSLAAMASKASIESMDKGDPKSRVGGNSLLVAQLLATVRPPVYKNNICFMILNQVREVITSVGPGGFKQPGGKAVEHFQSVIVQLKRGKDIRYETMGSEKIEVSFEVVVEFRKNKKAEGNRMVARFMYNNKGDSVGIDSISDLVNTAKRAGVFKGAHYKVPGVDKPFHGETALKAYLDMHPAAYQALRRQILERIGDIVSVDDEEDNE